jgi:hypothetical protein
MSDILRQQSTRDRRVAEIMKDGVIIDGVLRPRHPDIAPAAPIVNQQFDQAREADDRDTRDIARRRRRLAGIALFSVAAAVLPAPFVNAAITHREVTSVDMYQDGTRTVNGFNANVEKVTAMYNNAIHAIDVVTGGGK